MSEQQGQEPGACPGVQRHGGRAASRRRSAALFAAGQAQHIVANYRPWDTLMFVFRRIGEHFAGTPYGGHFASSGLE